MPTANLCIRDPQYMARTPRNVSRKRQAGNSATGPASTIVSLRGYRTTELIYLTAAAWTELPERVELPHEARASRANS